ncbi:TPA: hypothetical protein ACX6RS_004326, partial [Photobacterium damselae]
NVSRTKRIQSSHLLSLSKICGALFTKSSLSNDHLTQFFLKVSTFVLKNIKKLEFNWFRSNFYQEIDFISLKIQQTLNFC